ncbi:bacteriodes thetaiotaomicron symbiotic chitinase [Aspergillus spinulosporus]
MVLDTGRPSRQSNTLKLPIAFSSLAVIAIVLLSYAYRDSPVLQVPSPKRPAAEKAAASLEEFEPHNHTLYRRLDPYSCTKDIPCHTVACCGFFFGGDVGTCGFGDTFCGSDCVSQCDAKPECGADADPPGKTCPLNVCCSKYGFCGTTDEFCDASQGCQSNCGKPAVPPGKSSKPVTNKVIGYYEAWSARRECYPFPPAAIPIQGLTHVNFAFGYIDPKSFEIVPMDGLTPSSLFTQTADVRTFKTGLSDLEVFVSLGGWTFSDNDTATQPTFGDIARTESNRQTFANNLVDFMKKYGFDGVDLDWEYPGAGDRGGHEEDTQNYVLLLKTLRETFDRSSHGPYGLTFTIPSSYWYLRWFDVPSMLEYADWTNMMSYDLHGVWDKENPIGDIVQGHTNLTEIKQSMDLLWRNNVPPEKVVLGLGFYGRSFQLKSRACSSPGCQFAGAAKAGDCTNNAGTLAYFEIQDIISEEDPEIIHDKDAGVKYFTFGNDQWVSFDDEDTFKQKTDYANDVGLGGLMIWSIDQDDKQFTALEGLLGTSLQDYDLNLKRAQVTDAGHWTSINGQQCVMSDCGNPAQCPAGYGMAPNGNGFQDNCGSTKYRIICCPLDAMPTECLWRGGESSVGRPSCHGQCHTGESTLFHSRHATKNCLRPGFQAFCCTAETWARQIEACVYGSCGKQCGAEDSTKGMVKIAQKQDNCYWGQVQHLCCPADAAFQNCHWVGKGTCDDNECDDNDVQVDTATYGDSPGSCVGNSRKKVLCCDSPKNLNPFLPVALDKVFPTLPPAEDYPQFDLQNLGGNGVLTTDLNANTFGMIIIVGPEDTVQSLRRRDGSDLHVLDCGNIRPDGRSHIRLVCPRTFNSTCDKLHRGGVEGTILRMPEGCGPGTYTVLHALRPAPDRSLPYHVVRSASWDPEILEAEISYDFGLVKRDSGDIYIRIDYSNSLGYWKSIVEGDPARKKRSASPLHERFYSSSASDWKAKFDEVRNAGKTITSLGQGYLEKSKFDVLLSGETKDDCSSSDDGFLKMDISGTLHEELEFGYSLTLTGALNFNGKGFFSVPAGMAGAKMFSSPVSAWGFSHPGICNFGPSANVEVHLTGEGEINGDFTANFIIGNDGAVTDSLPTSTGSHSGGVSNQLLSNPFSGALTLPSSSSSKKRQSSDATILALRFLTTSQMKLNLNFFQSKEIAASVQFNQSLDSYLRIKKKSDGSPQIIFSNALGTLESYTVGDLPWGDDPVQSVIGQGNALVLHEGAETPDPRGAPDINGYALFGVHDLMGCSNSGGGGSSLENCYCMSVMDQFDRTLDLDPETGDVYDFVSKRRRRRRGYRQGHDMHMHTLNSHLRDIDSTLDLDPETGKPYTEDDLIVEVDLEGRAITYGAPVDYTVNPPTGNSWTITMNRYPNGQNGASLNQARGGTTDLYGAASCGDCGDIGVSSSSDDPDSRPVSEHIHERQTEARAQEFMMSRQARMGDSTLVTSVHPAVPRSYLDPNSYLFTDYATWDPNGPSTITVGQTQIPVTGRPIDMITNAYGSDTNPNVLVNADSVLNGYKARVWVGHQPMSDDTWNSNGFDLADVDRTTGAITAIRTTMQVMSYLNDARVNANWATVVNTVVAIYDDYQNRVQRVDNVSIYPRQMYQEYVLRVVIPDIENMEIWVTRRINQLRALWQPLVGQNSWAQLILDQLETMQDEMDSMVLDFTNLNLGLD